MDSLLALSGDSLPHAAWIIGLAIVFGLFMAWSIGANDVANAMGTSVGSKALTLMQAIIVAGIFEFAGSVLVGRHVSDKIREKIFEPGAFEAIPDLYVLGMLASLLSAATWLLFATWLGLPVSTTHSIVGAVVGFGMVALRWELIAWGQVVNIVASWVVSPLMAGAIAYGIFTFIRRQILFRRNMVEKARQLAPFFMFAVFLTVLLVTLYKGLKPVLKPLGLEDLGFWRALLFASPLSLVPTFLLLPVLRRIRVPSGAETRQNQNPVILEELRKIYDRCQRLEEVCEGDLADEIEEARDRFSSLQRRLERSRAERSEWGTPETRATERIFGLLQVLSACSLAFAHGANDVANAVGPLAGVVFVAKDGAAGLTTNINDAGVWGLFILLVGAVGIVLGLGTWGWRVIETIGRKITELTPTRGFAATYAAALTILIASRSGLPISTTHTLVGAVLGVGFARGVGALNFRVVRDIVVSWIVTLPAGAILAVVFYYVLKLCFGA